MSVDRLADVFNIQAEIVNDETNLGLRSFVGGLMWERICLHLSLCCCPNPRLQLGERKPEPKGEGGRCHKG